MRLSKWFKRDLSVAQQVAQEESRAMKALEGYIETSKLYGTLCAEEMELEANRHKAKYQAIKRILAAESTNDLTGRAHSASSAEAIVQMEPEYKAYLERQRDVVVNKNMAFTAMESNRLVAQLAIAKIQSLGGV